MLDQVKFESSIIKRFKTASVHGEIQTSSETNIELKIKEKIMQFNGTLNNSNVYKITIN